MYTYTPNDVFAAARLLDTSDPVLGGAAGIGQSNEPLKILADLVIESDEVLVAMMVSLLTISSTCFKIFSLIA